MVTVSEINHVPANGKGLECVAWQDSIACSSETALKWDASFRGRADASGRAVLGVHEQAYNKKRFNNNEIGAKKAEEDNDKVQPIVGEEVVVSKRVVVGDEHRVTKSRSQSVSSSQSTASSGSTPKAAKGAQE